MKLTNKLLRQIIKEELENLQNEMMSPNYAQSHSLDLNKLEKTATRARQGDSGAKIELQKALQLISSEVFNQKLDPSGAHAMFYYKHISTVDPDTDMDEMYPDADPGVDLGKMYPEEEPKFY
jgi:hypothetical protein